jgi:hypothetical protein
MTNEETTYDGIVLLSVLPINDKHSNDFLYSKSGFVEIVQDWVSDYPKDKKYTPIGWSEYYGAPILVDNITGKIKVCWNEYDDLLEFKADGLADLISKMAEGF